VVLVEPRAQATRRLGEALPPAAGRLLADMGLFEDFVTQCYAPCYARSGVQRLYSKPTACATPTPMAGTWIARGSTRGFSSHSRGAGHTPLTPARLVAIQRSGDGWQVGIATAQGAVDLAVGFVIDAAGRAASLARCLGTRRRVRDRLVCGWVHGWARPIRRGAGLTTVEAVEDGWVVHHPYS
jgi:hypothetical protein